MDPITHCLLGAATGYALFGRQLGRRAALIGAIAGEIPDVDIFIGSASDPLLAAEYHRHFTHALPFAPVGALLVALPWILRERYHSQWKLWWACAFFAYLTHGLLDSCNSYGTQLLRPFSDQRFQWSIVAIVDPIFTLVLAVGLVAALRRQRRLLAGTALGVCLAYLAFGAWQHHRVENAVELLARQRGHQVERMIATPAIGNNIIWRTLYQYTGRIYIDRVRVGWFGPATINEGTSAALVTFADLTAAEAARNQGRRAFERFAWFTDGWVARPPDDETVLGDMRYSLNTDAFDPIWGIRFTPVTDTAPVIWVNRSRDRRIKFAELWAEIIGNAPGYHTVGGTKPIVTP